MNNDELPPIRTPKPSQGLYGLGEVAPTTPQPNGRRPGRQPRKRPPPKRRPAPAGRPPASEPDSPEGGSKVDVYT